MKVFISWHGDQSQHVANTLREYIRKVFLGRVEAFLSNHDIPKGSQGTQIIDKELMETDYCIACLTRDNLENPWINFEAGSASKNGAKSKIWTLLVDMESTDLPREHPLARFQYTEMKADSILSLFESINNELMQPPIVVDILREQFKIYSDDIIAALSSLPKGGGKISNIPSTKTSKSDVAKETFDLVRELALQMNLRFADMRAYMVEDSHRTQEYLNYITHGAEYASELNFNARRRMPLSAGGPDLNPIEGVIENIRIFKKRVADIPRKVTNEELVMATKWGEILRDYSSQMGPNQRIDDAIDDLNNSLAKTLRYLDEQEHPPNIKTATTP